MTEHDGVWPTGGLGPDDSPESSTFLVNERGKPLTWGATPLASSPAIYKQQQEVKKKLGRLFHPPHVPSYVSSEIATMIEELNMSRTVRRETKNSDSFGYRKKMDWDGIAIEDLGVIQRAIWGFASPAEVIYVAKILGIPTIEVASLTHPYGQRIKLLKPMRKAVNHAIVLHGGKLITARRPTYEVIGTDSHDDPEATKAIFMTRETPFGDINDHTDVTERSSFSVMLSALDPRTAKAIRSIPFENNHHWYQQVQHAGALMQIVPKFLADDNYEAAIPMSTTSVERDAELEALLLSEQAKHERQKLMMAGKVLSLGNMLTSIEKQ